MLGEDLDPLARRAGQDAQARRAQPDLAGRLLARGVEDAAAPAVRAGEPGRRLEQERRLADAGFAAEQDERARDQPATEHPVELADPED